MANVKRITIDYGSKGIVVYAIIRREVDNYLLNDATGEFANAPADPFVTLTEDGTIKGRYEKDENRAAWDDGKYSIVAYEQVGGSPVPADDTMVGSGMMLIEDDAELTLCDIITVADLIHAKTTNLPASPAATGAEMDLVDDPNATAVTAIQGTMQTKLDDIQAQTDLFIFDADDNVLASIGYPTGTVVADDDNEEGYFKTDLTSAVEEFWVGGWVKFTSGDLANQPPKKIIHYDAALKFLTTSAFTSTPAGADEFLIINQ